ncbi:acetyltransferase (GNAT) family protein [Rhodobacter aestuarii]|uniref:Acetyltransferase (GNAT) family protein n=1 Tax=Rhodobacter aestuarii TaxID=453582 RepID=A0A1N7N5K2_9RHOB|nr:GNAT family N-acetyltransferase [Rhodobacter aestuarii]PTV96249.1 acetyltransferase (GNAT) family protein [Rhodobacter aestuarii]SIS93600.1 Acetyltransferase (GNAT) family protein [Rhodobacter aestuarii]
MKILLRHGLEPAQRAQAAGLYWRAFGGKLGRVIGPEAKALRYIERVIDPAHVIAATDEAGRVLGVVGFRTPQGSFVAGTREDLVAVYGRFGALWRAFALAILAQDLPDQTVSIDGLAVAEEARGLGLGGALMKTLCEQAQAQGFGKVRLNVVGENLRARELYDRLGFAVTGRVDRWITAALYGYRTVVEMERQV